MLSVNDRVKQLRLNHVYNIAHGNAPHYMCHNFILVNQTHSNNTRPSHHNFVQPRIKGKEDGSFFVNAIKDWNNLPENVKVKRGKINFKKFVKTHVLTEAKAGSLQTYL